MEGPFRLASKETIQKTAMCLPVHASVSGKPLSQWIRRPLFTTMAQPQAESRIQSPGPTKENSHTAFEHNATLTQRREKRSSSLNRTLTMAGRLPEKTTVPVHCPSGSFTLAFSRARSRLRRASRSTGFIRVFSQVGNCQWKPLPV